MRNPDDYLLFDLGVSGASESHAGGGGPVPPWDDEDEEGGDGTGPTPPADEEEEAVFEPTFRRSPEWLEAHRRGMYEWAMRWTNGVYNFAPAPDPFARERGLLAGCGGVATVAEAMEYARRLRQRRGDE